MQCLMGYVVSCDGTIVVSQENNILWSIDGSFIHYIFLASDLKMLLLNASLPCDENKLNISILHI